MECRRCIVDLTADASSDSEMLAREAEAMTNAEVGHASDMWRVFGPARAFGPGIGNRIG